MNEQRFETLETKIAHLEKAVQELSDVLLGQQKQIDSLGVMTRQTAEQLAAIRERMAPEGLF